MMMNVGYYKPFMKTVVEVGLIKNGKSSRYKEGMWLLYLWKWFVIGSAEIKIDLLFACTILSLSLSKSYLFHISYLYCFITTSGGSYQDLVTLSDSFGEWHQHNVSDVTQQGGNFTDSPVNSTLILPKEEFNILGGHTTWQVTVMIVCNVLSELLVSADSPLFGGNYFFQLFILYYIWYISYICFVYLALELWYC